MAKIKWEEDQKIIWSDNPYKWDEVLVLIKGGAAADTGATEYRDITRDFTEERRKSSLK